VHAERAARLSVGHPRAVEDSTETGGEVIRPAPALGVVGQRTEGENSEVARGDDDDAEPRPPELDERRVRPRGRSGPLDGRVDRTQRGSRHAVLKSCPGRSPKRVRSGWKPLVEPANVPSERQDLASCQVEAGPGHGTGVGTKLTMASATASGLSTGTHVLAPGTDTNVAQGNSDARRRASVIGK
jgi:hypothetical protein